MKSILEDIKTGAVETHDIPAPELRPGGMLVRTHFSAISAGTERVKVETGEKSLLRKAMARPDLVKQVVAHARQNGVRSAFQKVQARLDTLASLGYSCAGTVLAIGDGVNEFRPGDRVACGGVNYATHSELNFVPCNLAVHVPNSVSLKAASLTTIGAIAMQGLRQAQVSFGETVAIVGAGLVGVLAVQIAKAAGCRVIAIDRNEQRASNAQKMGAHLGISSEDRDIVQRVREFSRYGVDAAVVTAATPSADPLELAAELLRDRGRIVVVGDVGMGVSRNHMYMKELSLLMSRSYGPGRYDPSYEEDGRDYPIGYIRWTEERNMEAFIDLLAARAIDIGPILDPTYPVSQGSRAYDDIRKKGVYTAIIDYETYETCSEPAVAVPARGPSPRVEGELRIGLIGVGAFARSVLVPNIKRCSGVVLESVASLSGVGAESARKVCGFKRAQSVANLLFSDELDGVFIASHHDSHAKYVAEGLARGKKIFVEKPLATTPEELDIVRSAHATSASPFLMVGFNRRFAPATDKIREHFKGRCEPMVVHERINAGVIPLDHWIHADGGRIVGELCHFVDWARAIVDAPIQAVSASALPDGSRYHQDNVSVTLTFVDGSIANLLYLANGDRSVPKEYFEVFSEGKTARLDDWSLLRLGSGGKERKVKLGHDKGHRHEVDITIAAMKSGCPAPIPILELIEVTEATFAIQRSLRSAGPISLRA